MPPDSNDSSDLTGPSEISDMTAAIAVAIAIVQRHGKFLVGIRPAGTTLAGLSEFPGGKLLSGEAPGDAAVRECWEETGLHVTCVRELLVETHEYPHGRVRLHFFLCEPVHETSDEQLAARGFTWGHRVDLAARTFPDGNARVLQKLLAE